MSLRDALTTLISTVSAGGNLLLNIAPDHNGRLLPLYEERLRDIGLFVNAHSEAIFASKPWIYLNDQGGVWYVKYVSAPLDGVCLRTNFNNDHLGTLAS